MYKHSCILIVLFLLLAFISSMLGSWGTPAQAAQTDGFTNQLALLAIAPPPGNSGILDLYQLPSIPGVSQINVSVPGYPLSAAWSPDGGYLAYIMISGRPGSDAPPSDFDIYLINRQGTGLMKLTDSPNCPEIGLAWSADSQALFFSGFCRDSQATTFWRLDLATGLPERLGEIQWDGTWAVWSPDLSRIALLAPRKAEDGSIFNEVLLVTPDGQEMTNLANDAHPGYQLQQSTVLAWSPQSDWLAYATKTQNTDQGTMNQIVLVRADGSERKVLLTSQPGQECLNPLWSPGGQRLAFTCANNLFTIQNDGADLQNLTNPSAGQVIEYPAWLPGGERLAFINLTSDGKRRLESIQPDGSQRQENAEILAVQIFGLVWNPVAQPVGQTATTTSSSMDRVQAVSPTPGSQGENQSSISTPGDPRTGQSVVLTPTSLDEDQARSLSSGDQSTQSKSLSPILLLVLLLVAGGVGVYFVLRQSGKVPSLKKHEDEDARKHHRERRERARSRQTQAVETFPARSLKTAATLTDHPEEQLQQDRGDEVIPEQVDLLQQGIHQIRGKNIQGGIATLRQYLEIAPDDSTAWLWLGWASGLAKEYRTAERCFLQARRMGNPQAGEALEWLEKQRSI